MDNVIPLIIRSLRTPFLLLIGVYSVAVLGLVLIPGVDDEGNTWHMGFFHAFYFVSYTATTIGYGEVPYEFNDAQRLWVLTTIYSTVISWFYTLGKIIALMQNKAFIDAVAVSRFKKHLKALHEPFYLICGLGETGKAIVTSLTKEHCRAVIVEKEKDNLNKLNIDELKEYVPSIIGDASDPYMLELAGITHPMCRGVIAVTASDKTNLKIAISSKLLHPDIKVACRSEFKDTEENMLSFGTDYIINPYESFADTFSMLIHSPSLHLIHDWLTDAPDTKLNDPIYLNKGPWILCGYGRFGREIYKHLKAKNIPTVIIDPDEKLEADFDLLAEENQFIIGTGTDHNTLNKAGAVTAAGIVAGSDNDSNNLSIIMTALAINPDIFVIARQNKHNNRILYHSSTQRNASPDAAITRIVMHPREIIARKVRAFFLTPLLDNFLHMAKQQDEEWANITISRLSAVVGDSRPHTWSVTIDPASSPTIVQALKLGRTVEMSHLTQDPGNRQLKLRCIPLLLIRDHEEILLPEEDIELKLDDEILFCGTPIVKRNMHWTLNVMSSLNYVMSFKDEPESYLWRLFRFYRNCSEHRRQKR